MGRNYGNREPAAAARCREPSGYTPGRGVELAVAGYRHRLTPATAERLAGEPQPRPVELDGLDEAA